MLTEQECINALPAEGFLRSYVEYATKCTDAHLSYHILTGLSLLTQVVPETLYGVDGNTEVYPVLFSLLVGASSESRKSKSINLGTAVVRKSKHAIMPDFASKEAMIALLADTSKRLLVLSEFGHFLASTESSHRTPIKTAWNDCWDCQPLSNVRAKEARPGTGKVQTVESPRMTILAASDTKYLSRHTELTDWESGFFARFLIMFAQRERYLPSPPNDAFAKDRIVDAYLDLYSKAGRYSATTNRYEGYTRDAEKMWDEWAPTVESRSQEARFGPLITRAGEMARRIAILLACDYGSALGPDSWKITADVLAPAIAIAELHITSALALMEHISENEDMRDRGNVLRSLIPGDKTYAELLTESRMLQFRFERILKSLSAENLIVKRHSTVSLQEKDSEWGLTPMARRKFPLQALPQDELQRRPSVDPFQVHRDRLSQNGVQHQPSSHPTKPSYSSNCILVDLSDAGTGSDTDTPDYI